MFYVEDTLKLSLINLKKMNLIRMNIFTVDINYNPIKVEKKMNSIQLSIQLCILFNNNHNLNNFYQY